MSKKITSDLLSKLRSSSIESRSDTKEEEYNLPEQTKKLIKTKRKSTPTGVSLYDNDLSLIRELQQFFFSNDKIDSSTSKVIRCALRLASSVAKENEYLLLSIHQEVENEDARKK